MFDILEKAENIVSKYCLCDYCLGRLFAQLGRGLDNNERGYAIKLCLTLQHHLELLTTESDESKKKSIKVLENLAKTNFNPAKEVLQKYGYSVPDPVPCYVCEDFFIRNIDPILKEILSLVSDYEFNTFLIGARIPRDIAKREDEIKITYGLENISESFKSDLTRVLGKRFQKVTGKVVDYKKPDLIIMVDIPNNKISVHSAPIFIYGRYRKYVRNLPQNKWLCPRCRGKGCEECSWTGKKYPTSVEEIISEPIIKLFKAEKTKFHGAGREDIDVRMLGSGRPFVVEILNPKIRTIDLKKVQEEINKHGKGLVDVSDLKYTTRDTIKKIKVYSEYTIKTYRAIVSVNRDITEDDLKKIEEVFNNIIIEQRTPLRVLHRRADKLRRKKVYKITSRILGKRKLELTIICQGGLYIKELISGDKGRTRPNISNILGAQAVCEELDVVDIAEPPIKGFM
ncbi:MAG: tRNA pseudouridine(54/55) synthase Pus10 [Thermoprotei archaeon]|nr:MAG: tRNA pseudouridine(54/55) synthase Pus10 [Thermoprotei archaeon]